MPEEPVMSSILKTLIKFIIVLVAVAAFFSLGAIYSHNMQQVVFQSERLVADTAVVESVPGVEAAPSGDWDGVRGTVR